MKLSEFDMVFKPKTSIKDPVLADFVAKFTNVPKVEETMEPAKPPYGASLSMALLVKHALSLE